MESRGEKETPYGDGGKTAEGFGGGKKEIGGKKSGKGLTRRIIKETTSKIKVTGGKDDVQRKSKKKEAGKIPGRQEKWEKERAREVGSKKPYGVAEGGGARRERGKRSQKIKEVNREP